MTSLRNVRVIEKMKLVSFSLFLDASPLLDPRCPLDNWTSLYKYTTYVKGVLGLGGGGEGVLQAKEDINRLTKIDHFARWSFLLDINCINIYSIVINLGRLFSLV